MAVRSSCATRAASIDFGASSTAAASAVEPDAAGAGRRRRGRGHGRRRDLLAAENPADEQAEERTGRWRRSGESRFIRRAPGTCIGGHCPAASGDGAASTSRYSRTARSSPTQSAWPISAWPIDTSSRCGSVRKSTRLSRSRSCPALTPRPSECASSAAAAYVAKLARPAASPDANARANGSVYSSTRSAPSAAAQRTGASSGSTNTLTRMPRACSAGDRRAQRDSGVSDRPAGLARDLARRHRHERALIGLHGERHLDQIRPRIALDVELDRADRASAGAASSRGDLGARRACGCARSSARGCTVMPGAPAARHVSTASITLGIAPPRELRSVATLLTLTDSEIMREPTPACRAPLRRSLRPTPGPTPDLRLRS